ncbi:MAG: hypothetical protein ACT4O4_08915 [Nitrospiraceae bacterium]
MNAAHHNNLIGRFVQQLTTYPRLLAALGLLVLVTLGAIGSQVQPGGPAKSFHPVKHPALVYREQVKEAFDVQDPIIIAVMNEGRQGVFTPHTLALVQWLTDQMAELGHDAHPHVWDPDHIVSLATVDVPLQGAGGFVRAHFFDEPPQAQAQADRVRSAVMDGPRVFRSLVTLDRSATLIVTELLEPAQAAVYDALVALLHAAPVMEETLQLKVPGQPLVTTTPDPLRHAVTRQAPATGNSGVIASGHPHKPLF